MSRTTYPLVLIFTLSIASTSLGDDKQDQKKLQGKWISTAGKEKGLVMTFDGNKFSLQDEENEFKGTFTIDSAKTPKTMDLKITGGKGDELDDYKGKTSQAIYELDGQTFKWCAGEPGKDKRPTRFKENNDLYLFFERAKD